MPGDRGGQTRPRRRASSEDFRSVCARSDRVAASGPSLASATGLRCQGRATRPSGPATAPRPWPEVPPCELSAGLVEAGQKPNQIGIVFRRMASKGRLSDEARFLPTQKGRSDSGHVEHVMQDRLERFDDFITGRLGKRRTFWPRSVGSRPWLLQSTILVGRTPSFDFQNSFPKRCPKAIGMRNGTTRFNRTVHDKVCRSLSGCASRECKPLSECSSGIQAPGSAQFVGARNYRRICECRQYSPYVKGRRRWRCR